MPSRISPPQAYFRVLVFIIFRKEWVIVGGLKIAKTGRLMEGEEGGRREWEKCVG